MGDTSLTSFSVGHDDAYIVPVIQQALSINPANLTVEAAAEHPESLTSSLRVMAT